jgi:hypothetical protein
MVLSTIRQEKDVWRDTWTQETAIVAIGQCGFVA